MTIDDVLGAELATGRAVPTAVAGEPYESLARHLRRRPGRARDLGGDARLVPRLVRRATTSRCTSSPAAARSRTPTASSRAIRPGVVMLCPDGWSGVWDVDETVRKTYAIVKTR